MTQGLAMVVAVLGGIGAAMHALVSNRLAGYVGSLWAVFVTHMGGAVVVMLVFFLASAFFFPTPSVMVGVREAPWYSWVGGVVSVLVVLSVLFSCQTLPLGHVAALITLGQLVLALLIDHYGVWGFPRTPADFPKIIGLALVVGGCYLMKR